MSTVPIIYVNINNPNTITDGSSWATAFRSLQDALDLINGPAEIWIAKGIYIPTKIYSPNNIPGGAAASTSSVPIGFNTFNLPNNVTLYGGFNGMETSIYERQVDRNETVLYGAGSAYHVVTLGNDIDKTGVNASLDGLTISGGYANGPVDTSIITLNPIVYKHQYGGGIYCLFGSTLNLTNVNIKQNRATGFGGGIFIYNSDTIQTNCLYESNDCGQQGGAVDLYNAYQTVPNTAIFTNCEFRSNTAVSIAGGAVVVGANNHTDSRADFINCKFDNNISQIAGGFASDSLTANVIGCTFIDNYAAVTAGALDVAGLVGSLVAGYYNTPIIPYKVTVTNSLFDSNTVASNVQLHDRAIGGLAIGLDVPLGGAAICNYANGNLEIIGSKFIDNISPTDGGAIINGRAASYNLVYGGHPIPNMYVASLIITDCQFISNEAVGNGGAISSLPSSQFPNLSIPLDATYLEVNNCKFRKNESKMNGGAIYTNHSTLVLNGNNSHNNNAVNGNNIYASDSVVNGSYQSLYVVN